MTQYQMHIEWSAHKSTSQKTTLSRLHSIQNINHKHLSRADDIFSPLSQQTYFLAPSTFHSPFVELPIHEYGT
jgi:hypothetical protein